MPIPVTLHYEVLGEGPDLVILHGLFGSLDNWRGPARLLARNFRVWLVDQRNHGLSPHSSEFHYEAMAEDLHALLNLLALERVHLLGHSMGGKTAMLYSALHPDRVGRLIVEDMGPGGYGPHHDEVFRGLLTLPLGQLQSRSEADKLLQDAIPVDGVRRFLLKNLYRQADGTWAWRCNLSVLFGSYRHLLSALPLDAPLLCPTLFVKGELSDYLDPSRNDTLLELFVQRRYVTIQGAGHWVHAEQPAAFLQAVQAFLLEGVAKPVAI
jgi:esterase